MTTSPGATPPTRKPSGRLRSSAAYASWSDCSEAERKAALKALTDPQLHALLETWMFQAQPAQLPPEGDWSTWLFLGGRGAGKTRAGAEFIHAEAARRARFALVGPSLHDVREVMIEGPSGLRAVATVDTRPCYGAARRRLVWPNGAEAYAFSAEDPDSLRGPQFHAAWADEFCAWRRPDAVLANLRMGLRLGRRPPLVVTTTPRPLPALRRLMAESSTVVTRAPTADNAENLSPDFLAGLHALYGGGRLAAQELEGLVVEDEGAALWRAQDLHRCRGAAPARLERTVVAVDPPATAGGDACGIVAAGRADGRGYVLADHTVRGLSPMGWAARAAAAAREVGAAEVVAESNQGGEMVRAVLALAGCEAPVRLVHASKGKRARAEPVAALYESGRVVHCGSFPALEEELMALGAAETGPSPDRADALVWALTALLLTDRPGRPRLSVL